ncbi:MAG: rhodanese-like domain-containing protein [Acidobacteria bacterium]|nr:MAG: rhodanese-like domain-containing protein [Acidobacteriota bacterium]
MHPAHRYLTVAALILALPLPFAIGAQARAAEKKEEKPEAEPFGRFTVDQVERRLGKPNVYVFDGNDPTTYEANHLPGAVRLNHEEIKEGVLPKDKAATLIFYCMNLL